MTNATCPNDGFGCHEGRITVGPNNDDTERCPDCPPRFEVRDVLANQSLDLISRSDRRRRERYLVWDLVDDTTYDAFASKRAATGTARDLNQGLYGPLEES